MESRSEIIEQGAREIYQARQPQAPKVLTCREPGCTEPVKSWDGEAIEPTKCDGCGKGFCAGHLVERMSPPLSLGMNPVVWRYCVGKCIHDVEVCEVEDAAIDATTAQIRKDNDKAEREFVKAFTPNKYGEYA